MRLRDSVIALFAVAVLTVSCAVNPADTDQLAGGKAADTQALNANGFKVVGYMPSWQGDENSLAYGRLTHINYAFLLPNSDGSLRAIENPGKLQNLVAKAHANGVKVIISIGGWMDGNDSPFEVLASQAWSRTAFVNNVVNFVNQYGLDGADVDWEYPDVGASSENHRLLMTELANAMHARGKLCTIAVVAKGGQADGVSSGVFGVLDFINLMAYDGGDGSAHSPYQLAVDSINYWRGRGLAQSKVVLGVPFYGRPTWNAYKTLVAADSQAPYKDTVVYAGQTVWYNGIETIKSKTRLAKSSASGIMIWELSQDTTDNTSLLKAVADAALEGSSSSSSSTSTSSSSSSGAATSIVNGALYEIVNVNSGKAWDVAYASTADGAAVQQCTRYYNSAQTWRINDMGNGLKFTAQCSGKVLDVPGANAVNKAKLQQWTDNGTKAQRWGAGLYGNAWKFFTVINAKCIDIDGASKSDGVQLQLWDDNGNNAQRFYLYKK